MFLLGIIRYWYMFGKSDSSQYLTLIQASKLLQVHANTLRNWDKNGVLKAYRIGTRKVMRYKKEDLIKFIEKNN
jgi:excisionase family DNA binding protein